MAKKFKAVKLENGKIRILEVSEKVPEGAIVVKGKLVRKEQVEALKRKRPNPRDRRRRRGKLV